MFLPNALPQKYAPISAIHTKPITANKDNASSSDGLNDTSANQNGSISIQPTAYACQPPPSRHLHFNHKGMTTNQKANTRHQPIGGKTQPPQAASNINKAEPAKYGTRSLSPIPHIRLYSHNARTAIRPENAAHRPSEAQNSIPSIMGNRIKAVMTRCFNMA